MEREWPRPSLVALLGLVVGQVWAQSLGLVGIAPALIVFVVALLLSRARGEAAMWLPALAVAGAFAALGLLSQSRLNRAEALSRESIASLDPTVAQVRIEGTISGEPIMRPTSALVWLSPGARMIAGEEGVVLQSPTPVRVRLGGDSTRRVEALATGDSFAGRGHLESIAENPTPGEMDEWYDSQGAVCLIRGAYWESSAPPHRSWFHAWSHRMRCFGDAIEKQLYSNLSRDTAGVVSSIVLGRTAGLSLEQTDDYRRSGLLHLFSVSGLHAGIVAMILFRLCSLFGLGPRGRAILILVALTAFCAMTGFRTPAIRSALFTMAFLLQPLAKREIDVMGALCSIALVMIIAQPIVLWQLDFQMSFACAIALVIATPANLLIEEAIGSRFGWTKSAVVVKYILQTLLISVAVQLVLAPILWNSFGQVSLIAPLSNVLVLFSMSLVMGWTFMTLAIEPLLPEVGSLLMQPLEWSMNLLDQVAAMTAQIPGAVIEFDRGMPIWACAVYFIILLGGRWQRLGPRFSRYDGARSALLQGLALAAFLTWVPFLTPDSPRMTVHFLDVGQGDATLVTVNDGASMLVDAGPMKRAGLVNQVRRCGVTRLDILVLTHADADHIGGAAEIVRELHPRTIIVGGSIADTDVWNDVAKEVDYWDVPILEVRRGSRIDLGAGVAAEVLHPVESFLEPGDDRNDASVVMRVTCGDVAFLLTGDAEADAERDMLASLDPEAFACSVLKAGHHGSSSSSTMPFLVAANSRVAVLSCGKNNRYGHPAPDVMARLAELGIDAFRTDHQGTIRMTTDGKELSVEVESSGNPTASQQRPIHARE